MLCSLGSDAKDAKNTKCGASNTQVPTLSVSLTSQPPWGPVPVTPPAPSTVPIPPGTSIGHTRCPASPARVRASRGPRGRRAEGADAAVLVPAVEGQWLEWGAWSRCSVTCANGTQQRTRKCSVSAHGWAECRGAHADARECSNPTCPSKAPRASAVLGSGG